MKQTRTETTIDVKLRRIEESGCAPHYIFVFGEYASEERVSMGSWNPDTMCIVFKKHDEFEKDEPK